MADGYHNVIFTGVGSYMILVKCPPLGRGTRLDKLISDRDKMGVSVLRLTYQNELYELRKWIDNTNSNLNMNMQLLHTQREAKPVREWINAIASGVQKEYPFYAATLTHVADILFLTNGCGAAYLNPTAFGELIVIIRHIGAVPCPVQFWAEIHPQIINVSHGLYTDGHYSIAAEKAVKEVETRLREKFTELKPGIPVPTIIGDVIGALMSENGAFKFCDISTISGRNYRRGIQMLFEGTMMAYRNPAAHANLQYEKHEAMEQIMLASQLMYVLDGPLS